MPERWQRCGTSFLQSFSFPADEVFAAPQQPLQHRAVFLAKHADWTPRRASGAAHDVESRMNCADAGFRGHELDCGEHSFEVLARIIDILSQRSQPLCVPLLWR